MVECLLVKQEAIEFHGQNSYLLNHSEDFNIIDQKAHWSYGG